MSEKLPPFPHKGTPVERVSRQDLHTCAEGILTGKGCGEFLRIHHLHPMQYPAANGFSILWCPKHGPRAINSAVYLKKGEAPFDASERLPTEPTKPEGLNNGP